MVREKYEPIPELRINTNKKLTGESTHIHVHKFHSFVANVDRLVVTYYSSATMGYGSKCCVWASCI